MDDECGAVVVVVWISEYEAPEAAAADMDEEFDVVAPALSSQHHAPSVITGAFRLPLPDNPYRKENHSGTPVVF
jgi:hypothetical protein